MNINGLEIQWIVSPFTGKARNWESRMANMNNMGQFSGDMDRNEVEIDLNKFMALLQEKSELKDRIRELEDVNNVKELQENIQTQYIRVAELLKEIKELEEIIRRVSKQPEMAEK